ncbi:MAG TPA: ABC transporter permease [Longimicrobiales bacterium]|nr:ABC transporter permease [Longimicrobiales bacterium]
MHELATDFRYALRGLLRAPGFALIAILTLALGIGANSAIFSVLNGVILRPLPYEQPERLVRVASQFPTLDFDKFWISPPEFFELKERVRSFESMGAYRTSTTSVGGDEAPLRVTSAGATHDLFTTLGVPALMGRAFNEEEALPNAERVATLSYELWQGAFAADPQIVGRIIQVNGNPTRVTGVMPPGFDVADARVQIWGPLGLDPANRQNRGSHFLDVVARLRPGATEATAREELQGHVRQWAELNPGTHVPGPENHPLIMASLQDDLVGGARGALLLLLGAVGFVLLIACANVANLLLARAESRQKEIAVRAALGAGRFRLVRQFLTEGLVLAVGGGILGLAFGWAGVRILLAANPQGIPRSAEIGIDGTVLMFTFGVALATGLLFGLAPALHLSRRNVVQSLRDGSGRTTAGHSRLHVRRLLVVSEVALAVVLVVGSALMLRSFAELQKVDAGFEPNGLLSFQLFLPAAAYADASSQVAFHNRLQERLSALPGVASAAAMSGLPPRRDVNANDTEFEGLQQTPEGPAHNVDYYQTITRDYLATMRIPLVSGRAFNAADEAGGPVILVNERLARVFYPDVDPIGRRMRPCCSTPESEVPWFTIIGVVKDVKQGGLDAEAGTEMYFLYPQGPPLGRNVPRTMNVVVRTEGDPMRLAGPVQAEVRALDATLPVASLATMTSVMNDSVARPRFITLLLSIFAAVALALAAIGTYGVMAYSVAQRRQEIGIRMALGAEARGVQQMVLGQGFAVTAAGLVIGVGGALVLTRLLSSLLFNVSAVDPMAFLTAPLILAVVALLACYIPARRATRVDPASVLKD